MAVINGLQVETYNIGFLFCQLIVDFTVGWITIKFSDMTKKKVPFCILNREEIIHPSFKQYQFSHTMNKQNCFIFDLKQNT